MSDGQIWIIYLWLTALELSKSNVVHLPVDDGGEVIQSYTKRPMDMTQPLVGVVENTVENMAEEAPKEVPEENLQKAKAEEVAHG
jgi:hypothetical protein